MYNIYILYFQYFVVNVLTIQIKKNNINSSQSNYDWPDGISRAEDPESKNKMIQVWLENGIFKVPTVPKARTPQNSSHANMEEERPRRHQQSGGRRSNAPSLRAGSERSVSPMSFVTALDNTEPEQVIDADATEITVPTRRDRIQVLPPRRQRARFERAKLADAPVFCPTEDEFKVIIFISLLTYSFYEKKHFFFKQYSWNLMDKK